MGKRNLLNLGLLVLIGVLVLLVVYEPGIEAPVEPPPLLQLDKVAITRIAIRRDGQKDVVLERDGKGEWWMTAPVRHAAEPYRIDSLLRIATLKGLGSFAATEEKLAAYQLDKPRVTLTLNESTTLAFGGSTPLDQRRYVLLDNKVHLITDTLYYHLIGSYPTFLRKALLPPDSGIDAITLPGLSIAWVDEKWQLQPAPEGFSADQVNTLLDNWKFASALEIKPYDGKPGEKVSLTLSGVPQPLELLLTSRSPDLILARPEQGIQYHLDANSAAKLLQLPAMSPPSEQGTEGRDSNVRGHGH